MLGIGSGGPVGPLAPRRVDAASATSDEERHALAILVSVDGLGPMSLARLLTTAGSAAAVVEMATGSAGERRIAALSTEAAWEGRSPDGGMAARIVAAALARDALLGRVAACGLSILTIADAAYPARLRAIALPPHVLFVSGDPTALGLERTIAVVGTRRPTPSGRALAGRIGRSLVRAGACVVSGLAVGVDGAAHESVVREGGITVAVLGSGHGRLYPHAHERLARAIVDAGGAVVSELAPDVAATRGTFPRRNRVISGLSDATIVVEAPVRSGALTTAAWALEQGRGCFLVPGALDAPMSAGCLAFLREAGAEARIVAGLPELLDDLGLSGAAGLPDPPPRRPGQFRAIGPSPAAVLSGLDATPRQVAEALIAGATTVDELVAVTTLPVATVLASLTRLESSELVASAYGRYHPAGGLAS